MNKSVITKINYIILGLFLPFFVIAPLSGGLYVFGEKGKLVEIDEFIIQEKLPERQDLFEERVRQIFEERGISFEFEYANMLAGGADLRPTSKEHYQIRYNGEETRFLLVQPNFWKKLIEINLGNGPHAIQWLQVVFVIGLFFLGISSLCIAFTSVDHRKALVVSSGVGVILFFMLMNL